jgi:predicted N-formylglutamate amidohydrolase
VRKWKGLLQIRKSFMSSAAEIWSGSPVKMHNANGTGAVVLVCEHASSHIPDAFGDLGLNDATRQSHVAWDPGALAVSLALSAALDAPLVAGTVSRLLYDCNRPPEAESAMPVRSEAFEILGNRSLTDAQRQERIAGIYEPFKMAVSDLLAARKQRGQNSVVVTIHSFTPIYFGKPRAVEIGVLHDSDTRLADAMLGVATEVSGRRVERNEPYGPQDGVTHSLKLYGVANDLANVMIEIRNDLLRTPRDEIEMTSEILALLRPALATFAQDHEDAPHA